MRDPKIEAWLDKLLVDWNYVEKVSLDSINFNSDSRNANQVRFELLDTDNYNSILRARQAGEEFPAMIINRQDDGFNILDGNHRMESALEMGMKTHDAYVVAVEPGSALELQLMLEPNTRLAAKRLTEEEAIRWAIYLADNTNYTQKRIAEMIGMSSGAVSSAVRQHQAFVRASRLLAKDRNLFNSWEKLTVSDQLRLDKISSDIGWRACIEAVVIHRLSHGQVTSLVNDLKGIGSDQAQVKAVDAFLKKLKSGNTVKRNNSEKRAWEFVKMHAGAIKNVDPKRIERELSSGTLDERQYQELDRYLEEAQDVLNAAREAVNRTRGVLAKAPRKAARRAAATRRR